MAKEHDTVWVLNEGTLIENKHNAVTPQTLRNKHSRICLYLELPLILDTYPIHTLYHSQVELLFHIEPDPVTKKKKKNSSPSKKTFRLVKKAD